MLASCMPDHKETISADVLGRADRQVQELYPKSARVEARLREVINLVLVARISSWYTAISTRELFLESVKALISTAIVNIRLRFEAIDPVVLTVAKLLPVVTQHLHEIARVEAQVLKQRPQLAASHDAKAEAVLAAFSDLHPGAKLGPIDNPLKHRREACRKLIAKALPSCIPASELTSQIVKTLLLELVSSGMLLPLLDSVTDPVFLNEAIIQHAGNAVREQTQVQEYKAIYRKQNGREQRRRVKKAHRLLQDGDAESWTRLMKKIDKYNLTKLMALRIRLEEVYAHHKVVESAIGDSEGVMRKPPRYDEAMALINRKIQLMSGNAKASEPLDIDTLTFDAIMTTCQVPFIEFMADCGQLELVNFWNMVVAVKVSVSQREYSSADFQSSALFDRADSTDALLGKKHVEKLFRFLQDSPNNNFSITEDERMHLNNYITHEPDNYDIDANEIIVSIARRCFRTLNDEYVPRFKDFLRASVSSSGSIQANNKSSKFRSGIKVLPKWFPSDRVNGEISPRPSEEPSAGARRFHALDEDLASAMNSSIDYLLHDSDDDLPRASGEFGSASESDPDSGIIDRDKADRSSMPVVAVAQAGDLVLGEAIQNIDRDIDATNVELTHVEQRRNSTSSGSERASLKVWARQLQRQLRYLHAQRSQYELQRSEHGLFDRAQVSIDGTTIDRDKEGDFVVYIISVTRKNTDSTINGWLVGRRYTEFANLFASLRSRFPAVTGIDFPKKQFGKKTASVSQTRRPQLELFLRTIIKDERICESYELRAFLSQSGQMLRHKTRLDMSRTILDGIVSVSNYAGSLVRRVSDEANLLQQGLPGQLTPSTPSITINGNPDTRLVRPEPQVQSQAQAYENLKRTSLDSPSLNAEDDDVSNLARPIVNFVLEAFDLRRPDRAIRKRAIVLVVQQLLGGTIESRLRESITQLFEEDRLEQALAKLKEGLMPRTDHQEAAQAFEATAHEATLETMQAFMVRPEGSTPPLKREQSGASVSSQSARAAIDLSPLQRDIQRSLALTTLKQYHPAYIPTTAAQRLHSAVQYRRLNVHLAFRLLDVLVAQVFGYSTTPES
ncbi:tRNA (guanine-N(7)-)-methyltransferase (tRNA(m7G46)-methyltransferase) [Savitreella phatthalungensis]